MKSVQELETKLAEPSSTLVDFMRGLQGDILVLGVGGKMGPSLAHLAKNAANAAGVSKRVIGVARFSSPGLKEELEQYGAETISADLLNESDLQALPNVKNVIYMVGHKFGTTGQESLTWAMNTYLPGRVAEKFRDSRIVSFSTGNVYPLTSIKRGGPTEESPTAPIGEYAQSCLGRERMFEYFSARYGTPVVQYRLNYAIDMRYGVLLDIAKAVYEQRPFDLRMSHVNVIWQGDANEYAIRSLGLCASPAKVINITGPETVSTRWLAEEFGKRFNLQPVFANEESDTALLNNASLAHQQFGYPRVTLGQMIDWTAEWVQVGGTTHSKPTHFQEREGRF